MSGNKSSPAQAEVAALPAATTQPHDPAGHRAISRRPADLPRATVRKKTARYASPLLLGAAMAAALGMAAPAMASPVTGHDATSTGSISPILKHEDIVTGVRGTTNGKVILTGSQANGDGTQNTKPFLHESPLTGAARRVSALTPPFAGFETGTFYGPDTSAYNPDTIPAGQVRAVGSYRTSRSGGVLNHGMIYLGPVSGQGGSWTKIDVPTDGSDTVGGVRACPQDSPDCLVMDTIAHSTMGDLVVGNYDLNLGQGVSGNAFIYNMSTRQWTLLQLGGSLASGTTLYGIWQNGGPGSPNYTLAGGSFARGSSAHGNMRAFLMNYNERTGVFGTPQFYNYGNTPQLFTHFDGITAVPGGFNLATISSAQASSMAFVPATDGDWPSFGHATWYPIDVAASRLCSPDGCSMVTANTVFQNQVMGLYLHDSIPGTYLAKVPMP
jgi:hypothetical protein